MLNNIGLLVQRIKKNYLSYLVSFLLLLSIPPYFMWELKGIFPLIVVFIAALCLLKIRYVTKTNVIYFCLAFIFYLYLCLRSDYNIFGYIATMAITFMFLSSDLFLRKVFDNFCFLYTVTMIPSIIMYILVVFVGVGITYNIIEPLNVFKSTYYYQFPFLVVPSLSDDISFRFFSYYDEPGVVGTISGIILLVRKIDFKKWAIYPLLISGILSFSFAFILMLIFNVLIFQQMKTKIIILFVSVFSLLYLSTNEVVDKFIFSRFKIEDGKVVGDNRTIASFDDFWGDFVESDHFLWGYGQHYSSRVNSGGASYKDLIINYGIVGFISLVFIFTSFAWKKLGRIRPFLIYVIIFVSIIYQRPFIANIVYFSLFTLPIYCLKNEYSK